MSNPEFALQYNKMESLLYAFACRLTNDHEEAKDLLQETAYKAFRYRSLYQPQTNLKAWLMTIMRNTFINEYRQRTRRRNQNEQLTGTYWVESVGLTDNHGESAITVKEITSQIDALEDWMRVPFTMHCQGYKYEDIAETLSIPLGTVKSRIFFARKKLQEALTDMYATANPLLQ